MRSDAGAASRRSRGRWRSLSGDFPSDAPTFSGRGLQAVAILGLAGAAYRLWSRSFILGGLAANARNLPADLKITSTLINQIAFNLRAFLTEFADPRIKMSASDYFLNFFLKSSLFGEWTYKARGTHAAMRFLSAIYLAFVVCFGVLLARSLHRICTT